MNPHEIVMGEVQGDSRFQVLQFLAECVGLVPGTLPDAEARNKFGLGIECYKCIEVTDLAVSFWMCGGLFLLHSHIVPNLVYLQPLTAESVHHLVHERCATAANTN